jgi:HAE1 family hydrophobic/amphiphilic exporter-1
MKIYESSVKKPISTILIFVGVIVLGLFSLRNLSVDMFPDMDLPYVAVVTTYPGASAADIEQNITDVLEANLNTVDNLKTLTSKSQDNVSTVNLELEWGSDINEAANDVRDVIGRVTSYLPEEADAPIITKFSSSMIPVMVISATANESYNGLYKTLDDKLVNVLNRVDGVGAVNMMGYPLREIQVNVDPQKLAAYNMTVESLGAVIAAENVNIPGGSLDIGNNTFNIKADAEFNSSDDLRQVVLGNFGGRPVLLSDVAVLKDTIADNTMDVRTNDKRSMIIMIQKQSGANTVAIVKAVNAELEKIKPTLPPDVDLLTVMDGSEAITDSIDSLTETILFAFLFVILVVLFFLGRWRATLIICLTIPISLVVSFIYLFFTGSTLNIISLSSLSIAIGMVVDDAIVVLENITKHIERGSTPREAAIYATNEVWLAVIATTLVIVAVFMPLTMVGGMAGIMFRELGWIVSIVVVVSTIAAITLTPMLSSLMLKAGQDHKYKGLGRIFRPIERGLDRMDNWYGNVLTWAVRHRTFVWISVGVIFIFSLVLMRFVPVSFMPESDEASMTAEIKLQQNLSVDYTSVVALQIVDIIKEKYPEIIVYNTSAGRAEGVMAAMSNTGTYIINLRLKLTRSGERERSVFEIADLLRQDLDNIPEVRDYTISTSGGMGGGATSNAVQVKVFGHDMDATNDVATVLRDKLRQMPTLRDVQLSRDDLAPEYDIVFDRDKLALYGLNSATAATFVRNRINGLIASKYRESGDEYDIVVRYDEPFRRTLEEVEDIVVYNSQGKGVRIGELGTITEVFSSPTIEHENRQRLVSVNVTMADGVALGTAVEDIHKAVAEVPLPQGVDVEIGGAYEDQQEAFSDFITLALLIILLVYIVMATQFESFKSPFIIMLTLFPAFSGVFLTLWITGTPLGLMALLGAIMLIGIVVKNGIVMVDYTNLLRERGSSINQAVIASGKSRLRPVLMTSLTTILGMLPLAIGTGEGSELWQPMGIAIIGGLTFSLILTLLVVPVFYSSFGAVGLKKIRKNAQ